MYLKNKIIKRLFFLIVLDKKIIEDQKVFMNGNEIRKVLIYNLFPFVLIKINDNNSTIHKKLNTEIPTIKINILSWIRIVL